MTAICPHCGAPFGPGKCHAIPNCPGRKPSGKPTTHGRDEDRLRLRDPEWREAAKTVQKLGLVGEALALLRPLLEGQFVSSK